MPWSAIKKFPAVIRRLREWGYEVEAPTSELRKALMLETGAIRSETLRRYMQAMEELDYIERKNERVILIKAADEEEMYVQGNII